MTRTPMSYAIDGDTATFTAPSGEAFIVDTADVSYVVQFRWYVYRAKRGSYVCRKGSEGEPGTVTLQRDLMGLVGAGRKVVVDHRNRNPLDNRRSNLRTATHSQNHANAVKPTTGRHGRKPSSRYKGVRKQATGWGAKIGAHGQSVWLGSFKTQKAAAIAYNVAAVRYYAEFACLNQVAA